VIDYVEIGSLKWEKKKDAMNIKRGKGGGKVKKANPKDRPSTENFYEAQQKGSLFLNEKEGSGEKGDQGRRPAAKRVLHRSR